MEELYLNDQLVDIIPNTIRQTKQVNTVADISNRQSSYTNQFKLPYTKKNITILEGLGFIGSTSSKPYEKIKAELKVSGLSLIRNGFAKIIKDTSKSIYVQIQEGGYSLKEKLSKITLKNIDYSYLGVISESIGFASTSGYVYPVCDMLIKAINYDSNGNAIINETNGIYLNLNFEPISGVVEFTEDTKDPMVFVRDLLIEILKQSGLIASGDILNDSEFRKEVISLEKAFNGDINDSIHDINCLKFVKDILFRYGLIYIIKNDDIHFERIESILSGDTGVEDWSDKFNQKVKTEYQLSKYGKENNIEYKRTRDEFYYSVNGNLPGLAFTTFEIGPSIIDWEFNFTIPNEHLPEKKTIYEWLFDRTGTNAIHPLFIHGIPLIKMYQSQLISGNINYVPVLDPVNIRLLKVNYWPTILFNVGSNNINMYVCSEEETSPYFYLSKYYPSYIKMMQAYQKHEVELNLSIVDIHQLDFTKLKYIEQLGGYFYLNKVKDWQNGKLTKVELVKAYPNVNNQGGTVPQVNNQGLGSALEMELG